MIENQVVRKDRKEIIKSIQSAQKLIKIGSSEGVTIPKKELAKLGAKAGDELKITVELVSKRYDGQTELMEDYQAFVAEYGQTLKNLADR